VFAFGVLRYTSWIAAVRHVSWREAAATAVPELLGVVALLVVIFLVTTHAVRVGVLPSQSFPQPDQVRLTVAGNTLSAHADRPLWGPWQVATIALDDVHSVRGANKALSTT